MAAVAAAVAVAAAADFVAEMWSYARSSCSGGTPIPFRLYCKAGVTASQAGVTDSWPWPDSSKCKASNSDPDGVIVIDLR